MERALSVYVGIVFVLLIFVAGLGRIAGEPSLQDIGKPCRDHGGVSQFVPRQIGPWQWEHALVVCRDGKVGRV